MPCDMGQQWRSATWSIEDVARAEAVLLEKVAARHPRAGGKPCVWSCNLVRDQPVLTYINSAPPLLPTIEVLMRQRPGWRRAG